MRWALILLATAGMATSEPRPVARPDGLGPAAMTQLAVSTRPVARAAPFTPVASRSPRQVERPLFCGRPTLTGQVIDPVRGPGACGIPDAVRITQVSGLSLMPPARMDCATAQALDDWVRDGLLPNVGRTGGGAVALRVAAGYSCRPRNNRPGARLSEHSLGRAIDISAVLLADGSRISVFNDWGKGERGRILRALWQTACGPFGTVLGPESDRFHRDHFHFDTARYRSGSFCR